MTLRFTKIKMKKITIEAKYPRIDDFLKSSYGTGNHRGTTKRWRTKVVSTGHFIVNYVFVNLSTKTKLSLINFGFFFSLISLKILAVA